MEQKDFGGTFLGLINSILTCTSDFSILTQRIVLVSITKVIKLHAKGRFSLGYVPGRWYSSSLIGLFGEIKMWPCH